MPTKDVILALAGDIVPDSGIKDISITRIGGPAVFPAQCGLPDVDRLKCSSCNQPMALLLSAYTPLERPDVEQPINNRYIYLYSCVTHGCKAGDNDGAWRALRCQLPLPPTIPSSEALNPTPNNSSASLQIVEENTSTDAWGFDAPAAAADDSTATTTSAFDFGDLCSALDSLGSNGTRSKKPTASSSKGEGVKGPETGNSSSATSKVVVQSGVPCLPAFYLCAQPQSRFSQNNASISAAQDTDDGEDDEDDVIPASAAVGTAHPPSGSGSQAEPGSSNSGDGGSTAATEPEQWDGEGYEDDSVLAADGRIGIDTSYLKFARQMWKCPEQCARYGFGGQLLWPSAAVPNPGVCICCGAARTFELQLMAPVISYLEEAAEWLLDPAAAEGKEGVKEEEGKVIPPPSTWDWVTVAVFTCSKSCVPVVGNSNGQEGGFVEELAVVCRETM